MHRRRPDHGREAEVEVVLVEELPASGGVGRGHGPAPAAREPGTARRRSRVVLGARAVAVVAAVTLLGTAGVLQSRQEADAAAVRAGNPALVRPVHLEPVERWHLADAWVSGLGTTTVLATTPDGRLHALDPATGGVRWSSDHWPDDGSGWCSVLHPTPDGAGLTRTPTAAATAGPAALALCERGRWVRRADGGRDRLTTVTVLDVDSGAVRAERTLAGGLLYSDAVDGDLLHAWADAAGQVGVVRWDPWTGVARWQVDSDRRVTERRGNGARLYRDAGSVSFVGAGILSVDLASGRERQGPSAEPPREVVVGRVADAVVVVRGDPADGAARTRVLAAGGVVLDVPGTALLPEVRAGADGADALLLRAPDGTGVQAFDASTGDVLWEEGAVSSGGGSAPVVLAQLDGVAVLVDGAEVVAVDLVDGAERWRRPLAEVPRLRAVTDGSVIVLPVGDGAGADGTGSLVAVEVRRGTELWRTPLPAGTRGVRPGHGLVLVETVDGVTALG